MRSSSLPAGSDTAMQRSPAEPYAAETAAWVQSENLRSIRLVTASYHMPRSLLEFRRTLPASVDILPHPVFPEQFRSRGWWRWWGSGWLAVSEYHKYLLAKADRHLRDRR